MHNEEGTNECFSITQLFLSCFLATTANAHAVTADASAHGIWKELLQKKKCLCDPASRGC